jgi:hypothetical protein
MISFDVGKRFIMIEFHQWLGRDGGMEDVGYAIERWHIVWFFTVRIQHPKIRGIVK